MKFVVIFEDDPNADPDIRKTHMAEHLRFLASHPVDAAGPLQDPSGQGRDGLWIVDAPDAATVETMIMTDPFWPTGLRAGFAILPWTQVYANGKALIRS